MLDRNQNRPEDARKELDEALQIRREVAQKNPDAFLPDIAETLNDLGVLDRDQKRLDEAQKELNEALQIRFIHPEPSNTANARSDTSNLGWRFQ